MILPGEDLKFVKKSEWQKPSHAPRGFKVFKVLQVLWSQGLEALGLKLAGFEFHKGFRSKVLV